MWRSKSTISWKFQRWFSMKSKFVSKLSYFWFPENFVLTHSLKLGNCIFFQKGQKNTAAFFIFPASVYVPLTQVFWRSLLKKKRKNYIFSEMPFLRPFYVVFFFRDLYFFSMYFFSWKSLSLTHSLISNVFIFLFPVSENKKIQSLYSFTRFC